MKTFKNSVPWTPRAKRWLRGNFSACLILAGVALVSVSLHVSAVSLELTSTAPAPGADDVYNFLGAENDDANINNGADANTYVALDRATQGQTFTTGPSSGGYLLTDIWIRHAGYTVAATSGNGTFFNMPSGSSYAIRVTDPSKIGQAGFVIQSETYTATGTENGGALWTGGGGLGDDMWLHLTLSTPVQLAPGTQYGFDMTTLPGVNGYFEWLGNRTNVLSTGTAYTGTAAATPGNTVTLVTGDRVFLVHLGHAVPAVPPELTSPARFVPAGQSVQVTARIPSVVNANNPATLVLTNNDPTLISLPGSASTLTLNFAAGGTNAQTFNVQVLASGIGNISVVPNASFTDASIQIGTPILAQERFQYDLSQVTLDGANGGSGFAEPWSQPTLADTIVEGLNYGSGTTFLTSSNAVAVSGTGNEAFRRLPGTYGGVGGGTVYVSFLVTAPSGLTDWGGLSFFNGTAAESLFMGTVLSVSANDTWGFLQGGVNQMNFAGSITPGPQVDLLIYRIDFPTTNGGMALVSFYADPPLNSNEPYSPTGSGHVNNFTFDRIRLGTSDTLSFDEIRIGTQWTNVMQFAGTPQPLPPPTPTLSVPARFIPVGQNTPVTVSIPANAPRPLTMVISNDNAAAFSVSATNPALVTLTFGPGATNVQTFNVNTIAAGTANLTVISNASVNTATLVIAAQVSARESFEYEAIADGLPGQAGGSGFDGNAWTGLGSVVSPGLSYSSLVVSSNAATVTQGGAATASRTLFTPAGSYGGAGGGTVWISFLVRGEFPVGEQHSAWLMLLNGTAQPFRMGLSTAEPNNGKWGFGSAGAGSNLSYPDSVTPSTNADFLVYRLDFPAQPGGLVNVSFFANPAVSSQPPVTPTGTGSAFLFTFDGIQLNADIPEAFDEIRVGGSWAEVVPSAAAVPALNIVAISGAQVRISWPTPTSGSYVLQSSGSLSGPWGNAGLTIDSSGGNSTATDALTGNAKFYRLQKQ